jgi:aromatic-L-amino-acid decarboxylase
VVQSKYVLSPSLSRRYLLNTIRQTTASDSALIAVVAARSQYSRTHPQVAHESLVVYTTTQTHSLGLKAAKILGLSVRAIEVEPVDGYALRGSALRAALEDDLKAGKHPFILSEIVFCFPICFP